MKNLMRDRFFLNLSFVFLLFVTGCAKKNKKITIDKSTGIDIQEILALHSEIPDMLIGFYVDKVIVDRVNPAAIEVVYRSKGKARMTQDAIKKSYISDMELLGWQQVGEFVADDIQLLFQKPGSKLFCSVLVVGHNEIRVTLLPKE